MKSLWFILATVAVLVFLTSVFLDKVLNPWLSKRWLQKTLQKIEKGEIAPRVFDISIIWDSEGFFVQLDKASEKSPGLRWITIAKVTAFKRDLWATDCICLCFEMENNKGIEVHEEMNGWRKFIEELPKLLPGCKPSPDWLWNVATPAFAPNVTEIFLRPQNQPPSGAATC